jgi:hypothetical protein
LLGKSVAYGGLEITVPKYETVGEITAVTNNGDGRDTQTAPPGAAFLLVNVVSRNVGDTERGRYRDRLQVVLR